MHGNKSDIILKANTLIDSSNWLTQRIDQIIKEIEILDIDNTDQYTIEVKLEQCDQLLQRSIWEEQETRKFIKKYKDELYE